jgi:diguanylate cyclase (GGDEF)-like protein/PAS domain S-box-containing protein
MSLRTRLQGTWNSLKTRIVVLTVGLALAVLVLATLVTEHLLRRDYRALFEAQQGAMVSMVAASLNDALAMRLNALSALAGQAQATQAQSPAQLQALLKVHPAVQNLFNAGLVLLDAHGLVVAEVPVAAGRLGANAADRDYFKAVMAQGKPVISSPIMGKALRRPVVVMAVPLRDAAGRVNGVLGGVTALGEANFLDRITSNRYAKTGETFIVAPQSRMIVSTSDKTRLMEVLPAPGVNPWIDRFMQGYEGSAVVVNPHGLEVLVTVRQVPIAGWYTSVILSTEEAFAPLRVMRARMLWLLPLVALFTAALLWWLLRGQLRPLMHTTRKLSELAESDQPLQPLPVLRRDEVGQLIGGFNHLIDILMQRQTELQESQARLKLLAGVFTHASEGILICRADGAIVEVNEGFTRITGYPLSEVYLQNPRCLKSTRHPPAFYADMWRDLHANGHWRGEIWNRRRDGSEFPAMANISVVSDAQGQRTHYVALLSDITALKDHEQRLQQTAHFDALTGLPNRVLLGERLRRAQRQTQRRGHWLAVAFIDLDGFKAVNDQYGHKAGDQVLVTVAQRLQAALRDGDTIARLGGDEFVAVLQDVAQPQAVQPLLARLLAAACEPVALGAASVQVSASIGVSFCPPGADVDADLLLRQADQAMYLAKMAGKNGYQLFQDETQEETP